MPFQFAGQMQSICLIRIPDKRIVRNYQEESKEHTLISVAAQSAKPARSTLTRMANESMRAGQMALVTALFMKLTNDR